MISKPNQNGSEDASKRLKFGADNNETKRLKECNHTGCRLGSVWL